MIICPFHPSVVMYDIGDAFRCQICPDCPLLTSLYPDTQFTFIKEEHEK